MRTCVVTRTRYVTAGRHAVVTTCFWTQMNSNKAFSVKMGKAPTYRQSAGVRVR